MVLHQPVHRLAPLEAFSTSWKRFAPSTSSAEIVTALAIKESISIILVNALCRNVPRMALNELESCR